MNKKKSMVGLLLIIAVLFVGIGYAAISSVTLNIVGNARVTPGDSSFVVHFDYKGNAQQDAVTGTPGGGYTATAATSAKYTGLYDATIDAMDFTKKDEYIDFPFVIVNESAELSATIASNNIVISSGNAYLEAQLDPNFSTLTITHGQSGTVTIRVKCLKTPTSVQDLTGFTVTISPQPAEA